MDEDEYGPGDVATITTRKRPGNLGFHASFAKAKPNGYSKPKAKPKRKPKKGWK